MTVSVRDDYAPRFGRQVLSLWSGGFASDHEGYAVELPGHDGFMVTLGDGPRPAVRVTCEAPRTDENYLRVDAAIVAAVAELVAARNAQRLERARESAVMSDSAAMDVLEAEWRATVDGWNGGDAVEMIGHLLTRTGRISDGA